MKKILLHACLICSLATVGYAQNIEQPSIETAKLIEERLSAKYVLEKQQLDKILSDRNLPERIESATGRIKQAAYVTKTGHIVYTVTSNIGAGRTLSTNKVWPGGASGTSLTGQNMPNRLGIWDGGAVLTTHQEFGGRVTQTDGAPTLSNHATHVAGTMIAAGVDPEAKGMAYLATLKAYDWNNDLSEMAQAANAGMLISNHSYGNITGWDYDDANARWEWYGDPAVSTAEDYKFGIYDDRAKEWDDLAIAYPNYLICKAAGNDRGDNKNGTTWYYSNGTLGTGTAPAADGGALGFDCISTYANAKNILTVGAVNKIGGNTGNGWTQTSDVVMSSFSGWGPTDDGRIKPDIVAPGVSMKSSISTGTTNYDVYQGTSMATPAVSGSLLLIQQHYAARKSSFMRSATLKALVIHTADEAGNIGPDYRFGWGLMNTASAVKFINDSNYNRLQERTLTNGQPQSLQFSADAGKPLKVTICWTDVSGTPVSSNFLDNNTKMLVNDLDIKLVRNSDNTTFNPYILDPANPNAAATTGDNFRDNVEMINITAPQAGNYTLTISHKGLLSGGSQRFSLLISNGVEKPLALFTASRAVLCAGQSVNFNDISTGAISQRIWYFPGGTPSTSTAVNPIVTYNNAGYYPVALKVTGGLGTDSTYRTDFINVGGLNLPFNETFEINSPTANSWQIVNPDAAITWEPKNISGTTPGSLAMSMQFFDYNSVGQRDGLVSPTLNLKSHTNINLTFKHAYTKFATSDPSDSLVIYASTNCGSSWIRLASFGENGTGTFGTFGKNGINTYASDQSFSPANASQWCGGAVGTAGCKTVSLNQFAGQPSVQLKFEGYSNFSNNLYIDNIAVDGTPIKPVAAFQAAKTNGCVAEGIQFSDKSENIPTSWNWTFVGGTPATSTAKNPVVSYAQTGSYLVKLKVANITGADSIEIANYVNIVVPPKAPNIKANGPTEFCLGDSVLLSTDSTGNNIWYANNIVVAQNVGQLYAKENGNYRVAKSNGSCEASSTIAIKAGVKPLPPTINSSITTGTAFCPGTTVTLTSDASTGNQWYRNNSLIPTGTGVTLPVTDSGSYTVTTKPNGCTSNPSLPKALSLLPRPSVGSITGADQPVRGESTPYSVTPDANLTFVWNAVNGTVLSGNNTANVNIRFNSLGTGTLSVSSKSAAGCLSLPSTKQVNTQPPVGLAQYEFLQQLQVYPIPTKNSLTLEIDALKAHTAQLKIVNLLGQTMQQNNLSIVNGKQFHPIDLTQFSKGIYFIELYYNESKIVKRIVVE